MDKVFTAGDMHRGQSLVVCAISEGVCQRGRGISDWIFQSGISDSKIFKTGREFLPEQIKNQEWNVVEIEFSILYTLQNLHQPWLDNFMTGVSSLADHGGFFILLGLALLISFGIGFFLGNGIMKNLFARNRPCWIDESVVLLVRNPRDYSFPSGHTLIAFEAAVSIWLVQKRWGIAMLVLAFLIGFSRMYLFVHFPTDVLGGMVLGTGIAIFVNRMLRDETCQGKI